MYRINDNVKVQKLMEFFHGAPCYYFFTVIVHFFSLCSVILRVTTVIQVIVTLNQKKRYNYLLLSDILLVKAKKFVLLNVIMIRKHKICIKCMSNSWQLVSFFMVLCFKVRPSMLIKFFSRVACFSVSKYVAEKIARLS